MNDDLESYHQLEKGFREISLLQEIINLLDWDMNTVMPLNASGGRGEQLAFLKVKYHQQLTVPEMEGLLEKAAAAKEKLTNWQQANILEMQRHWIHAAAVPEDLVNKLALSSNRCEKKWRLAKQQGDFSIVQEELTTLVALTREKAMIKAEKLDCEPYDALLNQYEPGLTMKQLNPIFQDLQSFLPNFVKQVTAKQKNNKLPENPKMAVGNQIQIIRQIIQAMSFDFKSGRLDSTLHSFSSGSMDDLRVAVHFEETDFLSGLMGAIHEIGHAFYEHGLPEAWRYQPVGWARGMALHESQSLIWEKQVGQTQEFWDFLAAFLQPKLLPPYDKWRFDHLYQMSNYVRPSFIRIEADEVTYPLHIILRYNMEQGLISGQLKVADIPDIWNEQMHNLLGVVPTSDREGCLQDIHWYEGSFGYFPTYSLGALMAAQLFEAALKQIPSLKEKIAKGQFGDFRNWLRTQVHQKASAYSTNQILEQATGTGLTTKSFKKHLQQRYLNSLS